MCCIILALDHPEYALVLASNRDEFLARPTLPLALHDFHPNSSTPGPHTSSSPPSGATGSSAYLSGLDALTPSGGTWLGVTPLTSHLSFLTNIADAVAPSLPPGSELKEFRSRGKLVKDWLTSGSGERGVDGQNGGPESMESYLETRAGKGEEYPGFNLVVGRLRPEDAQLEFGYLTNRGPKSGAVRKLEHLKPAQRAQAEKDGREQDFWTMAMSNASLDDGQGWEKVCWGRERLAEILSQSLREPKEGFTEEELVESLFEMLGHSAIKQISARDDLQSSLCVPPIRLLPPGADPADPKNGPPAWYATRTSTVLLIRRSEEGKVGQGAHTLMIERDRHALDSEGQAYRVDEARAKGTQRRFEVRLGGAP